MDKNIIKYLNNFSDDLNMVNKLIVGTYLSFNQIKVVHNKLIKSIIKGNDKQEIESFILLLREKNKKFDFEDLIRLFEVTIPSNDIVTNGAVYTPKYIKNYIVQESFDLVEDIDYNSILVADISCGAGAFLYTVSQKIKEKTQKSFTQIYKENIFGLDISHYSIERTKILLTLLALSYQEDIEIFKFNLFVDNALSFDWFSIDNNFKGFDIIVGNPPYVRSKHLSKDSKKLMNNWTVSKSGNADLYIVFFEIGLKYLKSNGILGYITINTFKRSVNARKLREYLKDNKIMLSIVDFGNHQIFNKKSTYTALVFIENRVSDVVCYEKVEPQKLLTNRRIYTEINYSLLDTNKGWMLNQKDILENIRKIERCGKSLGDTYLIKNGLATLSNDIFIFKPIKEDTNYYYHADGFKIENNICRDIIKPNKLKNENEIEKLKEKIIFPYYKDNIKKEVLEEEYFKKNYPYAYAYLLSHKVKLENRDKGKKNKKYKWFEFGRTQAISDRGAKLLFPYMSGKPYFVYTNQDDLLFYAGYAIFLENKSQREIEILKVILKSEVFWYYIKHTSKPYSGNFYALAKNYVKDFGICELSKEEQDFLLSDINIKIKNKFLMEKYFLFK